ncbi:mitochondrial translational activator, Mpa1 [Schizosaccharomyces osmophilus]|uniref:Mitochondrial translational activator, Mpa1 n=1 Tax=Schizosaccharomyces osmophilus TaxID=2545709 RepID=A0AAE9W8P9_9SCHI|nr:mitochondrial translational activator, Mpa1 [Schizosaccharomyces osmophilus]WBW71790.1 mitochondrial translational activator, Mpa1 [Schizosaccharomyces osmophilus]
MKLHSALCSGAVGTSRFYRSELPALYKRLILDARALGQQPEKGLWFHVKTYYPVSYAEDMLTGSLPRRFFKLQAFPYYNEKIRSKEWFVRAYIQPGLPIPTSPPGFPPNEAQEAANQDNQTLPQAYFARDENSDPTTFVKRVIPARAPLEVSDDFSGIGSWYLADSQQVQDFENQKALLTQFRMRAYPKSLLLQYVPNEATSEDLYKYLRRQGPIDGVIQMNKEALPASPNSFQSKELLRLTPTNDWLIITPKPNLFLRLLHRNSWESIKRLASLSQKSPEERLKARGISGAPFQDPSDSTAHNSLLLFASNFFNTTIENAKLSSKLPRKKNTA